MSSRLVNFLRLLRRVIVGRTDRETRHAQIDYVGSGIYRVYTCCRRSWGHTPDKVKEMCGSKLQKGCIGITCAMGCDYQCGDTVCTANCCFGPRCGEFGCHIHSVDRTLFGKKIKLPYSAYIRMYGRHHNTAGGR